jgi:hypothetical protein
MQLESAAWLGREQTSQAWYCPRKWESALLVQLADHNGIELWSGPRMVATLDRSVRSVITAGA